MLDLLIFAFALTSCKKEEVNNNGNNNGEIENPGGQQAFSLQILSPHKLKATLSHLIPLLKEEKFHRNRLSHDDACGGKADGWGSRPVRLHLPSA